MKWFGRFLTWKSFLALLLLLALEVAAFSAEHSYARVLRREISSTFRMVHITQFKAANSLSVPIAGESKMLTEIIGAGSAFDGLLSSLGDLNRYSRELKKKLPQEESIAVTALCSNISYYLQYSLPRNYGLPVAYELPGLHESASDILFVPEAADIKKLSMIRDVNQILTECSAPYLSEDMGICTFHISDLPEFYESVYIEIDSYLQENYGMQFSDSSFKHFFSAPPQQQ